MHTKFLLLFTLILFSCKTLSKKSENKLPEQKKETESETNESERKPVRQEGKPIYIEDNEYDSRRSATRNQSNQPGVIVYKTKGNYNNLVPVRLSDDKSQIVSYPAPSDLKKDGKLSLPTELKNGYLMDNLGIGKNTAFIKLTYEEYSKLSTTILLSELYKLIVDKEPFIEMYDCGGKENFTNIIDQLNQQIIKGEINKNYKKVL